MLGIKGMPQTALVGNSSMYPHYGYMESVHRVAQHTGLIFCVAKTHALITQPNLTKDLCFLKRHNCCPVCNALFGR